MKAYFSLVSEKLKCISDIQTIFQLIDFEKTENTDTTVHLQQLDILKTKLATLNAELIILKPEINPQQSFTELPDNSDAPSNQIN
mgnify:CR=1 FL=1